MNFNTDKWEVRTLRSFWLKRLVDVVPLYNAANRHYHNWLHVEKCLSIVDTLELPDLDKEIMNVAFVFHDAIYLPKMESERLSREFLLATRPDNARHADYENVAAAADLILLKEDLGKIPGARASAKRLKSLFDDVDYSILGAPWDEYSKYVMNVKKEYLYWYTEQEFWFGRKLWVEKTLKSPLIFESSPASEFFQKLEIQARKNLELELSSLHPL